MTVFYEPHWCFAFIYFSLFGDWIDGYRLLEDGISAVFLVLQHTDNHRFAEVQFLLGDYDILALEYLRYFIGRLSREVHIEDSLHDDRFLGNDLRVAIFTFFVAEGTAVHKGNLAVLEFLSLCPCDILTDTLGFGLCETCVYNEVQFAIAFQRIDVLFLEVDTHADLLE